MRTDARMGYHGTRKQMNRRFMKYVRMMNKNIYKDTAWNGRFVCSPVRTEFYPFPDGSGTEMVVTMCYYDHMTGKFAFTREDATWYCDFGRLWIAMNQFITEYVGTCAYDDQTEDFTKAGHPDWNELHKHIKDYTHWMQLH